MSLRTLLSAIILTIFCQFAEARLVADELSDIKLEEIEKKFGSCSPEMSNALDRLIDLYNEIDDLKNAEKYANRLVAINERLYKLGPETGYAHCKLASIKIRMQSQSAASQALSYGELMIAGNVSENHPYYGMVLRCKAAMAFLKKPSPDLASALRLYTRAATIYRNAMNKANNKADKAQYRDAYNECLVMEQYINFYAGKVDSDEFFKSFEIIENLYKDDQDNINLADALYYKAFVELKMRAVYQALADSEKTLDIIKKNLKDIKSVKYVTAGIQHINILQLCNFFSDADILSDQLLTQVTQNRELNQYGTLGALYTFKAQGMLRLNLSPEDTEYYANMALMNTKNDAYIYTSKSIKASALVRQGKLQEALQLSKECLDAYMKNASTTERLEKKYIYWLQYAQLAFNVDEDKGSEVYNDFLINFEKECAPYDGFRQFAGIFNNVLLDMALISQEKYASKKVEADYNEALKMWELYLKSLKLSQEYLDERVVYHVIASLHLMHSDHKQALRYAEGYYDYTKLGLLSTMGGLSASERSQWLSNKGRSDFMETTVPSLVSATKSPAAVSLLFNMSLLYKSILLSTERQLPAIVKKLNIPDLNESYRKFITANDNYRRKQETGKATDDDRRKLQDMERKVLLHPAVSKLTATQQAVDWKQLQKYVKGDEAAVEFVAAKPLDENGSTHYYALVLKSSADPVLVDLPAVNDNLVNNTYDFSKLYQAVWQPLEKSLQNVGKLYFSPDGILYALPIEHFGKENRQYVRLSSTRELANRNNPRANLTSAVLFGGLRYDEAATNSRMLLAEGVHKQRSVEIHDRASLNYLPASLTEVKAISKSLLSKNINVKLLEGTSGTEEYFKALSGYEPSILHIATHGFYYNNRNQHTAARSLKKMFSFTSTLPECEKAMFRTGIFLSGANRKLSGQNLPEGAEDGILTAKEISTMDLGNTRLAVLSACQSGLGEISGDGVFGLQRALKKAGVAAILTSLWNVDDEATGLLMQEFYSNYISGKSLTQSLALARDYLKKSTKYSDPRFWAAFVLMDDL